MTHDDVFVAERLGQVRDDIAATGRDDVRIVAVTKGFDRTAVECAQRLGLTDIGENYAQEVEEKAFVIGPATSLHFIGRIQRNKVRKVADVVDVWQSVARPEILVELAKRCAAPRALIQIQPLADPGKDGIRPDALEGMLAVAADHGVVIDGLMTIGVLDDPVATVESFEEVALLADRYDLRERSMGMSGDYREALSAGATMLRLGSLLFGPRPAR